MAEQERNRVQVFVRPRPYLPGEVEKEAAASTPNRRFSSPARSDSFIVRDALSYDSEDGSVSINPTDKLPFPKSYQFDGVFEPSAQQDAVYDRVGRWVVDDVLRGYNGTIFAYGQTGTGKTYTILGNENETDVSSSKFDGIIPQAVSHIFSQIVSDKEHAYTVSISYVQIYMETILDLFRPQTQNIIVREDPERGLFLSGVCTIPITSVEDCLNLLLDGSKNRVTAMTKMNAQSSRSHACLIVNVDRVSVDANANDFKRHGKLMIFDLAGSERIKKSGAEGTRLSEASAINLSLSALGNCINALTDKRKTHIPFRDSTLTRMLQDSLGGNAKTSLVVTVNSLGTCISETISSLRFGQRAKNVRIRAKLNEDIDYKILCEKLEMKIIQLETEIETLKAGKVASQQQSDDDIECKVVEESSSDAGSDGSWEQFLTGVQKELDKSGRFLDDSLSRVTPVDDHFAAPDEKDIKKAPVSVLKKKKSLTWEDQDIESVHAEHSAKIDGMKNEILHQISDMRHTVSTDKSGSDVAADESTSSIGESDKSDGLRTPPRAFGTRAEEMSSPEFSPANNVGMSRESYNLIKMLGRRRRTLSETQKYVESVENDVSKMKDALERTLEENQVLRQTVLKMNGEETGDAEDDLGDYVLEKRQAFVDLQRAISMQAQEILNLRLEKQELISVAENIDAERGEWESRIQNVKSEGEEKLKSLQEKAAALAQTTRDLEDSRAELVEFRKAKEEVEEKSKRLEETSLELSSIKIELDTAQGKLNGALKSVEAKNDDISVVRSNLEATEARLQDEIKAKEAAVKASAENESLMLAAQKDAESSRATVVELQETLAHMSEEVRRIQEANSELRSRASDQASKAALIPGLESELATMQRKLAVSEDEICTLQARVETATAVTAAEREMRLGLERRMGDELKSAQDEAAKAKIETQTLREKIADKSSAENDHLSKQCSDLRSRLADEASVAADVMSVRMQVESVCEGLGSLVSRVAVSRSGIHETEAARKIDELQKRYERELNAHADTQLRLEEEMKKRRVSDCQLERVNVVFEDTLAGMETSQSKNADYSQAYADLVAMESQYNAEVASHEATQATCQKLSKELEAAKAMIGQKDTALAMANKDIMAAKADAVAMNQKLAQSRVQAAPKSPAAPKNADHGSLTVPTVVMNGLADRVEKILSLVGDYVPKSESNPNRQAKASTAPNAPTGDKFGEIWKTAFQQNRVAESLVSRMKPLESAVMALLEEHVRATVQARHVKEENSKLQGKIQQDSARYNSVVQNLQAELQRVRAGYAGPGPVIPVPAAPIIVPKADRGCDPMPQQPQEESSTDASKDSNRGGVRLDPRMMPQELARLRTTVKKYETMLKKRDMQLQTYEQQMLQLKTSLANGKKVNVRLVTREGPSGFNQVSTQNQMARNNFNLT